MLYALSWAFGGVLLFVFLLVLFRMLWDPFYCCYMSSSRFSVLLVRPLKAVGPGVHVSECLIDSGSSLVLRHLTKFSRMLVVEHAGRLCLVNPCPLSESLRLELAALGTVEQVCVTNCFHHMNAHAYWEAYPDAAIVVPSRLRRKVSGLPANVVSYSDAEEPHEVFPGLECFALPDFFQEHVFYVPRANLLYCSDTLFAQDTSVRDPGRTCLSPFVALVRRISLNAWQPRGSTVRLHYAAYSRQFRRAPDALAQNVRCWRRILSRDITTVVTGHGVFEGAVTVTNSHLQTLQRYVESKDAWYDIAGRFLFCSLLLSRLTPPGFREWTSLYSPSPATVED